MKTMNKIIKLFVLILMCFTLVSCKITHVNKKTNHFVEGFFLGKDENNIVYCLEVKNVDKQEFETKWPINVVQDVFYKEEKYFQVSLYFYDENGNKESLIFDSLKEDSPNTPAIHYYYIDKNNNSLSPATDGWSERYGGYNITYNHVFIYLKGEEK